jgi:hypothetical protein
LIGDQVAGNDEKDVNADVSTQNAKVVINNNQKNRKGSETINIWSVVARVVHFSIYSCFTGSRFAESTFIFLWVSISSAGIYLKNILNNSLKSLGFSGGLGRHSIQ